MKRTEITYRLAYADGEVVDYEFMSDLVSDLDSDVATANEPDIVILNDGQESARTKYSDLWAVFEESEFYSQGEHAGKLKGYDLLHGIEVSHEAAQDRAKGLVNFSEYGEPVCIAKYCEYVTGDYTGEVIK